MRKILLIFFLSVGLIQITHGQKKGLLDRINNGLDKVNNGLNKALGYKVIESEWRRHGGGCCNSFGGWDSGQMLSPLNGRFTVRYSFPNTPYGISITSNENKDFGFAVFDPYGQLVYQTTSKNQGYLLNSEFTPRIKGDHTIIVFTTRRADSPLEDPGGKFTLSAQCEGIAEIKSPIFIDESINWGAKGGGGIGITINGNGVTDYTMFSPRNKVFNIPAKKGTPIHAIIEPFGVKPYLALFDPYGNLIGHNSFEVLGEAKADGVYKLIVATREKGAIGNFNIIIAGDLSANPMMEEVNAKPENREYTAAFTKEFEFKINSTSYFECLLASNENSCTVKVLDQSRQEITTIPNYRDRTTVKAQRPSTIYAVLDCKANSDGFYELAFFGDFSLESENASQKKEAVALLPQSSRNAITGKIEGYDGSENTFVVLLDAQKKEELQREKVTSSDGSFSINSDNKAKELLLFVEQSGAISNTIAINDITKSQPVSVEVTPIKTGKVFKTNNIYFQSGKATLLPESFTELNRVSDALKNSEVKIEIGGHTDDTGNANENLKLSVDRAEAVKFYLLSRGVQDTRLTIKGYGQTQPVARPFTEQNRALNRRVEFKFY